MVSYQGLHTESKM